MDQSTPTRREVVAGAAGPLMMATKMAVESYRRRKTLHWDARRERVVG
jgi:hypothetical protein